MPDEVYNLAAQSHVRLSFDMPQYTASVDGIGTLNILEAVRQYCKTAKVYQASTSELFGGMLYNMPPTGYTEESPLHPRSPYGCAKMYGLWITRNYKEAYGIYACNGILFNHESIRRGENFVTKKITNWVHEFHTQTCLSSPWNLPPLKLGNLHAKRDWGHAKDYVEAMWLMLQQENPQDFVVATNETYTVKNFVDECISQIGWSDKVEWIGSGVDQKLIFRGDPKNILIEIDPDLFRPSEVDVLLGDASKAKLILGWIPKYTFKTLVADMLGTKNNQ
jgi:GDPmannose 4,6-dehydratase